MWTGPAISTLSAGRAMVDVMNIMGYRAAALGNHEFDFGLDTLRQRISEMQFPLLAANVHSISNGEIPGFIRPYTLIEINQISIGVIGLASVITPQTTRSTIVAGLEFTDYEQALRKYVPVLKAEGAELLIVIGHICRDEMETLASVAGQLGITLIGGGHCHELLNEQRSGVTLIESGSDWHNYIQVDILFDDNADTLISLTSHTYINSPGHPDEHIASLVRGWHDILDRRFSRVIGYAARDIGQNTPEMNNMITDSWLHAYPHAQIAITNRGGIRQSIPAGDITIATIFGLMPFDNHILALTLNGEELIESLRPSFITAGFSSIRKHLLINGRDLSPDSTYTVLINDFMYGQSNMNFQRYDENPHDLQINYRQPLIDWLKEIRTTKDHPLDDYLDGHER